jgi:hypothetical protein
MRSPRRLLALQLCAAVAASCAVLPPRETAPADAFAARVEAYLARSGLGPDALLVIDNVLAHEGREPPAGAAPIVRELLGRPAAAADAATLFYRSVPGALRRLVDEASAEPSPVRSPSVPVRALVETYAGELAEAQRALRSAARGDPIDARGLLGNLTHDLPSAERIARVAADIDRARLDRAVTLFVNATARFLRALRAAQGRIEFPERPLRFGSPVGAVSIGTRGDDVHRPDAAIIVDPGGNDVYEREPVTGGAVSVIFDLGGDDRYRGSDVVVHGLSAIVDFSGDDRYAMSGPGLGAAIAGASLLLDFSGDDSYEAGLFGEGAAAVGLGALVDLGGDDTYRLAAGGQGFGMTGGVGLLWDRGGDDAYAAAGLPDPFDRGGGLSWAQGAAFGIRTLIGGGIGVLRDEAGDDRYEAQMYAQGAGYYGALGLLWDERGDDGYRALRYAQGNGVHEAVGVLRDEAGDDRYELRVGVGQGMGLDLALGVLFDGAGDDRYTAPDLAQGSATANGIGIVFDAGGADRWDARAERRSWGRAEWFRGLPSVGVMVYDAARSVFARDGRQVAAPEALAREDAPSEEPAKAERRCPPALAAAESARPLAEILREMAPGFAAGSADAVAFAQVKPRLEKRLRASMAELPAGDFDVVYSFGEALPCVLLAASPGDATAMWNDIESELRESPRTPFVGALTAALRERPAPEPQMQRILGALDRHPGCGVRAGALFLRRATANDGGSRASVTRAAQAALRSSCWRLQAAALAVLERTGASPDGDVVLPSFLRRD